MSQRFVEIDTSLFTLYVEEYVKGETYCDESGPVACWFKNGILATANVWREKVNYFVVKYTPGLEMDVLRKGGLLIAIDHRKTRLFYKMTNF